MILSFVTCARRLVGAALVLAPLLGHAQGRTTVVGAAAKAAPAVAAAPVRTATLTGRVSGPTTDSVAVSLRENPLDPKERLFRVPLNDKGDFKVVVPVSGATKADLVYGDDVAPLFLDPGTDIDIRFKGNDMAGTLRFKANNGAEIWRAIFAFDPVQQAVILVAADKQGINQEKFYKGLLKIANARYDRHLGTLRQVTGAGAKLVNYFRR